MLTHPTLDLLHELGLHGLAKGFKELEQNIEARCLEHAEWLALLLEHELTLRRQKRFERRARIARLRHTASVEDVDYRPRGLDRALFLKLAACDRIAGRRNFDHRGGRPGQKSTGGALGQKACRKTLVLLSSYPASVRGARARPRRRPLWQGSALLIKSQASHFGHEWGT